MATPITLEQAEERLTELSGDLAVIKRIATAGRVSLSWTAKGRLYVVTKNQQVSHRGTDLGKAVDAYNAALSR
ncbi:hypothetical protein [Amycolatopsis sp. H20-H5]|uniref:hypothetical protein n=1 Tax=Amycolatopsis sp. H20-H5 TaxID=3046309 RepID=UPI002DB5F19F|nr:hypothetical protein [Amycolatopsis sp. H20-H5]MEC3981157.1 hypothetical protein [Amycolatopsis sp. H20-H5]